jgi:hypothetical protein
MACASIAVSETPCFYRPEGKTSEVIQVLHASRNIAEILDTTLG